MPIIEAVRLALAQLRAQKLKSALTLFGVVISVAFLITIVSIIEGVNVFVSDSLSSLLSANSFELRQFAGIRMGEVGDEAFEWRRRPPLSDDDIVPVVEALPPGALWSARRDAHARVESAF